MFSQFEQNGVSTDLHGAQIDEGRDGLKDIDVPEGTD